MPKPLIKPNFISLIPKSYISKKTDCDFLKFKVLEHKTYFSFFYDFGFFLKEFFNTTNSNKIDFEFLGEFFTVSKFDTDNGFIYVYYMNYLGYEAPFIHILQDFSENKGDNLYCAYLSFYGSFFRIKYITKNLELYSFMDELIKYSFDKFNGLSRCDIKTDYFSDDIHNQVFYPSKIINIGNKTDMTYHFEGPYLKSWGYGNSKRNNTKECRCYDKLRDILRNGAMSLYSDYFNNKTVTRFEVQFPGRELRGINTYDDLKIMISSFDNDSSGLSYRNYEPTKIQVLKDLRVLRRVQKTLSGLVNIGYPIHQLISDILDLMGYSKEQREKIGLDIVFDDNFLKYLPDYIDKVKP